MVKRRIDKRSAGILLLPLMILVFSSCASSRVVIDRSAMEKMLWPAPPEKTRISYLWSVSELSKTGTGLLAGIFAGAPESGMSDPSASRRLLRPYSCFVDESGDLYITDTGAYRVTIISTKEGTSRNILRAGDEDFLSPIGVVGYQGKLYISDSLLKKVFILEKSGKLIGKFEGEFERPTSLALSGDRGIIYVADTLAHKIYLYSPEGKRLGSIGKNGSEKGEFNYPTHLWVDGGGRLYVTDSMNFRIQMFSARGDFETMFGTLGDAAGNLDKPKGVATDSDGNIYVVDSIKDAVKIFDGKGALLLVFGQQGRGFGQFWLPSGIFIDKANVIYVADTYNGRIQAFRYLGNK
ncbi:MAG: 6-bladed beta-propeller [Thermodesulfovibrionales bacterium]